MYNTCIKTIQSLSSTSGSTSTSILNANSIINNNDNSVTNNINVYFIQKNFTEAPNYKDIMAKKLTKEEHKYIIDNGPSVGREKLIYERCIKDKSLKDRPFHCLDYTRRKFLIRADNKWIDDYDGLILLEEGSKIMNKIFLVDDTVDTKTRIANLVGWREMSKNNKKTVKFLSKESLVKNSEEQLQL